MPDRAPANDPLPPGAALLEADEIETLLAPCRATNSVAVRVRIELARARQPASTIAGWSGGSIATFEAPRDNLVDVYLDDRRAARGQLTREGANWSVRIVEIIPASAAGKEQP